MARPAPTTSPRTRAAGRAGPRGAARASSPAPVASHNARSWSSAPRIRASAPRQGGQARPGQDAGGDERVRPLPPAAARWRGAAPASGREQGPGPGDVLGVPRGQLPQREQGQRPAGEEEGGAWPGAGEAEGRRDEQGHHQGVQPLGAADDPYKVGQVQGDAGQDLGERRGEVVQRTQRGQVVEQGQQQPDPGGDPTPGQAGPADPPAIGAPPRPAGSSSPRPAHRPRRRRPGSEQGAQGQGGPQLAAQAEGEGPAQGRPGPGLPSGAQGQPGEEGQGEGEHCAVDVQQEGALDGEGRRGPEEGRQPGAERPPCQAAQGGGEEQRPQATEGAEEAQGGVAAGGEGPLPESQQEEVARRVPEGQLVALPGVGRGGVVGDVAAVVAQGAGSGPRSGAAREEAARAKSTSS